MVVTAAVRVVCRGGRSGCCATAGCRVVVGRRGRSCCCCSGGGGSRGVTATSTTACTPDAVMTVWVVL